MMSFCDMCRLTQMKRLWPFCLALLLIAAWMLWMLPAPKDLVALRVIGTTNDAAGVPMVVFQATNCSSIPLAVHWMRFQSYESSEPMLSGDLPLLRSRSALTFTCSPPDYTGTDSWQVFVLYRPPASAISSRMDRVFRRLGLRMELNKWRSVGSPKLPLPNKTTGASAGWRRQLPMRAC